MSTTYLKNITGYTVTLYLGNPTNNAPIIKTIKPDDTINSVTDSWEDFVVQPLLNHGILTKLTLGEPPVITVDLPATINLPYLGTTTLTIAAIGTPVLSYQWYSQQLGVSTPIAGAIGSSLANAGKGYYYCVVTNAYGMATSTTCDIITALPA